MDTESKKLVGSSKTLCKCCQRQLYSFSPGWKLGHRTPKDEPHHESVEALVESAASCPLCEKLLASLSPNAHRTPPGTWWTLPFYIPTCTPPPFFSTSRCDKGITIRCKETRCLKHKGEFVRLVPETDPLLRHAIWREPYPSFPHRLSRINEWLHRCLEKHFLCGGSGDPVPQLPTRVLDVSVQGAPRLLVSNCKGRYVALSHCWGTVPIPLTTRSTLEEYTNCVPLGCLTKTFREAIEVTRLLGIQYLWIDSLCIIQDCPNDWEKEAAQMASVYRNAFLTFAATASPDGNGGLIQPVNSPTACFEVEGLGWRARENIQSDYTAHSMLREPLNRRAWTLQEALLSPRVLHFASDQMHWECYCLKESEDGLNVLTDVKLPQFNGDETRTYVKNAGIFSLRATVRAYEALKFRYPGSHDEHWDNIMEGYTTRQMTYRKDKLPALAGITQHVLGVKNDVPILGMWRRSLPRNLLWHVQQFVVRPLTPYSDGTLPSWTFLSLDGPIIMKPNWLDSGRTGPFEPEDIEILEASVVWDGPAMTSRLVSSKLRVRGKLCQARLDDGYTSNCDDPNVFRIVPSHSSKDQTFEDSLGRSLGECWLDTKPVSEEPIWFLKLGKTPLRGGRSERITIRGYRAGVLALQAVVGQNNVFSRIGAGFFWWNSRFDNFRIVGARCYNENGISPVEAPSSPDGQITAIKDGGLNPTAELRCIELV